MSYVLFLYLIFESIINVSKTFCHDKLKTYIVFLLRYS